MYTKLSIPAVEELASFGESYSDGTYKGKHIVSIKKRKITGGKSLVKSLLHGKKRDWRSIMSTFQA